MQFCADSLLRRPVENSDANSLTQTINKRTADLINNNATDAVSARVARLTGSNGKEDHMPANTTSAQEDQIASIGNAGRVKTTCDMTDDPYGGTITTVNVNVLGYPDPNRTLYINVQGLSSGEYESKIFPNRLEYNSDATVFLKQPTNAVLVEGKVDGAVFPGKIIRPEITNCTDSRRDAQLER
jgi:hypothetical protein